MPKERGSLFGMLAGDEPGPVARVLHNWSGEGEGEWGEKCIAKMLRNRVRGGSIFRNVYVPVDGRTAELDLVMVAQNGIYVFESKAYGGKIYGNPEHMNWMQYMGRTENSFYNPVKQNENHCRHLSRALRVPRERIFSFVVFENRADLSKVSPLTGERYVICRRKQLPQILAEAQAKTGALFSQKEAERICSALRGWQDAGCKERHIQQVQERMNGGTCPVCGKKLAKRTGKYGAFIGCTGYPACKYTRDR